MLAKSDLFCVVNVCGKCFYGFELNGRGRGGHFNVSKWNRDRFVELTINNNEENNTTMLRNGNNIKLSLSISIYPPFIH